MLNYLDAKTIANQLSLVINNPILIFNEKGTVIASSTDQALGQTFECAGRAYAEKQLTPISFAGQLQDSLSPGVCFPVFNSDSFVCVIGVSGISGDLSFLPSLLCNFIRVLNQGEYHSQSNTIKERSIRDLGRDMIDQLDDSKYEACQRNATMLNIDTSVPRYVLVIDFRREFSDTDHPESDYQRRDFNDYIYTNVKLFIGNNIFFNIREEVFVLLYEIHHNSILNLDNIYDQFTSIVHKKPIMGVGYICSSIRNYNTAFNLAMSALKFGQLINPHKQIYYWYDYRTAILLLSGNTRIREAIINASSDIIGYFQDNPAITETITAFFESGMDVTKTAEAMHYHRNTILYRLNKFTNDSNINIFNAKYCAEMYNLLILLHNTDAGA